MAIVQNALIGRTKKSVGGVTFTTWKGRNVLKSKPITVANPNSIGQQLTRRIMSNIAKSSQQLRSFLGLGFKEKATSDTAYNQFSKENNGWVRTAGGQMTSNASVDLIVANGSLNPLSVFTVTDAGGIINVASPSRANDPVSGLPYKCAIAITQSNGDFVELVDGALELDHAVALDFFSSVLLPGIYTVSCFDYIGSGSKSTRSQSFNIVI